MQRKLIGMLSLLFSSFLFAVPASAVDLPQCAAPDGSTDFVLVAEDNIIFEPQSPGTKTINGNVLVTYPGPATGVGSNTGKGFVKVGANTVINGTVIADTIMLPDGGADITACVARRIVAKNAALIMASCGNLTNPASFALVSSTNQFNTTPNLFATFATANPSCLTPPGVFSSLCGPTPVVDPCANAAASLIVPEGGTLTLPPAPAPFLPGTTCFGALVLEKGAVLTFGTVGPWTFKSVQMKSGSKLIGPAAGATVNVNNKFTTDAGVSITNINLNVAFKSTAEIVEIWNNSTLTNTLINAPFGKCHLHTGADFQCAEACCKILDVEPITAVCDTPEEVCACRPGFKFEVPPLTAVFDQSPAVFNDRNCVRCGPNDHPPLFPTCLP